MPRKPSIVSAPRGLVETNEIKSKTIFVDDPSSGSSPTLYICGDTGFPVPRPLKMRALRAAILDTGATSGQKAFVVLQNYSASSAVVFHVDLTPVGTSPRWIYGEDTTVNTANSENFDVGDRWRVQATAASSAFTNLTIEIEYEEFVPYISRGKL